MAKRNLRMPSYYIGVAKHQDDIPNTTADIPTDCSDSEGSDYSVWRVFCKSFEYTFCGIMIS